jgi:hypothetical protein
MNVAGAIARAWIFIPCQDAVPMGVIAIAVGIPAMGFVPLTVGTTTGPLAPVAAPATPVTPANVRTTSAVARRYEHFTAVLLSLMIEGV